jgi:hypothetical protein
MGPGKTRSERVVTEARWALGLSRWGLLLIASVGTPAWAEGRIASRSKGNGHPEHPSQLNGNSGWNGAHNSASEERIRNRGNGR